MSQKECKKTRVKQLIWTLFHLKVRDENCRKTPFLHPRSVIDLGKDSSVLVPQDAQRLSTDVKYKRNNLLFEKEALRAVAFFPLVHS